MNTTEPTEPAPDRHEASRAAFEKYFPHPRTYDASKNVQEHLHYSRERQWDGWKAALDHAAQEQPKCGWTADPTTESWNTDCGRDIKILVYDFDGKPGFCPGCGRRVESRHAQEGPAAQEQPPQTTSDSANTEIVQEPDIPPAFFESLAQAERGEVEPMFDDEQEQPAPDGSAVDETLTREDIKQMSLEMVIQNFNNLRTRFELVEKERDQARARSGAQLRGVELLREERDDLRTKLAAAQDETRRLREALDNLCVAVAGAGVRHPKERELLQECYDAARAALAAQKEGAK